MLFTVVELVLYDAGVGGTNLVIRVVSDDELNSAAQDLERRIDSKSPLGINRMKQLVADGIDQPLHSPLRQEANLSLVLGRSSEDMREGLAAFNDKRGPQFSGR